MATSQIPVKKPTLGTGGLDEDTFCRSFEDCPVVQIFSAREVTDHMKNIQDIISDSNKDWNKRVDALKKLRSLVIAGATQYEEFFVGLKNLEIPLQSSIKDLRSQVVREACITITYLSQNLGNRFDKAAEYLLQPLINLIQNSAKVMATSGHVAVKFIIQYTHSPRLIPIITYNAQKSKSKDIRRACCEFLELMLTHWPKHPLEKHIVLLQETIKVGIADADPNARVSARKAFKGFQIHFPERAKVLMKSLDPSYRRVLKRECMSASPSTSNIANSIKSTRPVDTVGELEKLKDICNSYKQTIDNASTSNEQLMKTVKLKTKKIVLLANKMKKRQHIINTSRSILKKRMMLIKELNEQNKQLREEYKEKLQSRDKLLRELDMKNQQIAELLVTNQQLNTNISSKESQINEQQKLIEDLNAQIKQLTERQKSFEIANHNYEIIITDQTEQLVVKTEELNVKKTNYDEEITSLAKKLAETTQELEITKQSTADQSMALARAKEEFKTLEQNYEETIATQTRLLSETTGELAEAKRNFDALEQNYEIFNKKKCCDLQEDNHYSWITLAMKIIIFALIILSYLLYRGYDFGFNVIREINLGNSPK